ncbi:LacI family DNA-binding transcriptional regulator [Chryseolinea lacunae]|uniref:LacI family DNA-binding transcriptional regulator n=1 Tax=Chryseolinea lacunae TaxID=2801331 RepID=A0ABS1L156_9BACT|nr:LacI family DNA-binding transcriptional regulator [Chryseolinea lacunae]MBL0745421.1 LacI family DNA-binding transcriptional regulator [Chryseolinea lacunae]
MKKKATIVDIANKLGITPSAVSKALSGHPRISDETKLAVIAAAKALEYTPNHMAMGLRKGTSGLIGILVPAIHYSFFATAIKGAEEVLSQAGYNVIIAQSKDNAALERKQLEGLVRAQVEGIIASMAIETKDFSFYQELSFDIPLVLFDRTFEDDNVSTVIVDDFAGAVKAVDHLVEMGYSRIAHLGGYAHILPFGKRIEGYKSALAKHGLPFRKEYLFQCAPNKDEGAQATERLLQLPEPPDAIFAASDYLAFGAIKAAKKQGLHVPDDLGLVGFSNEEFSAQVSPSITSVDQFSEAMGASAAELLVRQMREGKGGKEFIAQKRILSPKLIARESSLRKVKTTLHTP